MLFGVASYDGTMCRLKRRKKVRKVQFPCRYEHHYFGLRLFCSLDQSQRTENAVIVVVSQIFSGVADKTRYMHSRSGAGLMYQCFAYST